MNVEDLRKELTELINNIKDHSDRLSSWDHLPALEISVILAKINRLYERMVILRAKLEEEEIERKAANAAYEKKQAKIQAETVSSEPQPEVKEQTVPEEKPETTEDTPEVAEGVSESHGKSEESEKTTEQEIDDVASKLENQPINTLEAAIGLNERYLYSNELFDQNMQAFNESIKKLDNCDGLKEANEFLTQLFKHYNWDKKNLYVKGFIRLVERRFLSM